MKCPDCGARMKKVKMKKSRYMVNRENDLWICPKCGQDKEFEGRDKW